MSGKRDSNPRPSPWQGDALPTELFPHCSYCVKQLQHLVLYTIYLQKVNRLKLEYNSYHMSASDFFQSSDFKRVSGNAADSGVKLFFKLLGDAMSGLVHFVIEMFHSILGK